MHLTTLTDEEEKLAGATITSFMEAAWPGLRNAGKTLEINEMDNPPPS
jgi:hypothetical protein